MLVAGLWSHFWFVNNNMQAFLCLVAAQSFKQESHFIFHVMGIIVTIHNSKFTIYHSTHVKCEFSPMVDLTLHLKLYCMCAAKR